MIDVESQLSKFSISLEWGVHIVARALLDN
jgi:hypothetical protein